MTSSYTIILIEMKSKYWGWKENQGTMIANKCVKSISLGMEYKRVWLDDRPICIWFDGWYL